MTFSARTERTGEHEREPGWFLTATLCGALLVVLKYADIWSWWSALWLPLLGFAVGSAVNEWVLMFRSQWRAKPMEWALLVGAHCSFLVSGSLLLGLLPR
ncbi:hypothetical protein SAMN05216371_0253 [Streptomyces sp. TLI_053]|nr:hypothetical protein SAMN05216371_0253 [Streptomyces sp. TLI_053]